MYIWYISHIDGNLHNVDQLMPMDHGSESAYFWDTLYVKEILANLGFTCLNGKWVPVTKRKRHHVSLNWATFHSCRKSFLWTEFRETFLELRVSIAQCRLSSFCASLKVQSTYNFIPLLHWNLKTGFDKNSCRLIYD